MPRFLKNGWFLIKIKPFLNTKTLALMEGNPDFLSGGMPRRFGSRKWLQMKNLINAETNEILCKYMILF